MTLNLIFAKIHLKNRVKTIEEFKNEQSMLKMVEQNKQKHNEMMLRHYY